MKTKSKRLAALFMAFAMSVGVLQASVFAVDTGCNGSNSICGDGVTFNVDGTFTYTTRCKQHTNTPGADCEKTVTGKIATSVDKDGAITVDQTKSITPNGENLDASGTTKPTCVTPATVAYKVTVDGDTYTKKFTTAAATGDHQFAAKPATAGAAAIDANGENPTVVRVNDTSTCQAAGDVTYKQICTVCHKPVDSQTVVYKGEGEILDHQFIQNEKNEDTVFDQVIKPATCAEAGTKYQYKKCKFCGIQAYAHNDENGQTQYDIYNTTKGAQVYDIPTLPHSYKYTVAWPEKVYDGSATEEQIKNYLNGKIEGECTNCKAEAEGHSALAATIKKVTLDKTEEPTAVCAPGSKTYTVTYMAKASSAADATEETFTETKTIPYTHARQAVDHDWGFGIPDPDETTTVKPTCTKDGHYDLVKICSICGEKKVVGTLKLPATGQHTALPAVKENVVKATYAQAGSYDLVVRCADCGKVMSTVHKTSAKLKVNAPALSSVKNVKGKKATVSWKKASSVSGYQVQYATKSSFKSAKTVKTTASSKTISKLSKNKKYYVRVRSYKVVSGKTYYSAWTGAKTVTIRK